MNTEQKINSSIVEIDLIKKSLKCYCRAGGFKAQIEKLKKEMEV